MGKKLIVCLDGTWQTPETEDGKSHASNVLKFMRALKTTGDDGVPQVVYYHRGVGSGDALDKFLGGGLGWGLSRNVLEAYRWIANNFEAGNDSLYFVGFSRGAYTARSLAGLIGTVGLMAKDEVGKLPKAYAYYRTKPKKRPSHPYHETAQSRPKRDIEFIGVFDTVGSLGVPVNGLNFLNKKYRFHDVKLGATIKNAFQALAVDEFRKPFAPTLWEKPDGWAGRLSQAWFPGAHTDIGGGYKDHALSDLTLLWMVANASLCGLSFDKDYLEKIIAPKPRYIGRMGNEFGGFYKLLGKNLRPAKFNAANGIEIDNSVILRHQDPNLDYNPKNVEDLATLTVRPRQAPEAA